MQSAGWKPGFSQENDALAAITNVKLVDHEVGYALFSFYCLCANGNYNRCKGR